MCGWGRTTGAGTGETAAGRTRPRSRTISSAWRTVWGRGGSTGWTRSCSRTGSCSTATGSWGRSTTDTATTTRWRTCPSAACRRPCWRRRTRRSRRRTSSVAAPPTWRSSTGPTISCTLRTWGIPASWCFGISIPTWPAPLNGTAPRRGLSASPTSASPSSRSSSFAPSTIPISWAGRGRKSTPYRMTASAPSGTPLNPAAPACRSAGAT
mmetsp:Transcript_40067/g.78278  ORF Transcript_40067/g.78278 Transcript_40067/m.78278 type:complete len:210 (-) Transcript_40067:570-1199(-)